MTGQRLMCFNVSSGGVGRWECSTLVGSGTKDAISCCSEHILSWLPILYRTQESNCSMKCTCCAMVHENGSCAFAGKALGL
jgi:hypothetical protein